jgi:hypothetical protein
MVKLKTNRVTVSSTSKTKKMIASTILNATGGITTTTASAVGTSTTSVVSPPPAVSGSNVPFVALNKVTPGTRFDPFFRDSLGLKNNYFTMSNVGQSNVGDPEKNLLGSNVMPSKYLPTSFLVPSLFCDLNGTVTTDSQERISNVWRSGGPSNSIEGQLVSYQTNIYDAATWEIALALLKVNNGILYDKTLEFQRAYGSNCSVWADIDFFNTVVRSGVGTGPILNQNVFKTTPGLNYHCANQTQKPGDNGLCYPQRPNEPFRMRAFYGTVWDGLINPLDRTQYIGWTDYFPVLGENAWAFFTGPLQYLYIAKNGLGPVPAVSKIGFYDKEVQMALTMLDTVEKMSVNIPVKLANGTTKNAIAVLYCPGGVFEKNWFAAYINSGQAPGTQAGYDASSISNENNASLFAGLQILYCTLRHMETNYSGSTLTLLQSYEQRVYVLLDGIATYFRYLTLCRNTFTPTGGSPSVFYYLGQGGEYCNGQFYKNDQPALDCQTWVALAFMSAPISMNMDSWFSAEDSTIVGDYSYQNAIIQGFVAQKYATNSIGIWLNSRKMFGTRLSNPTQNSISGRPLSSSTTVNVVTDSSAITGVGYTLKDFFGSTSPLKYFAKNGAVVFEGGVSPNTSYTATEDSHNVSGEWTAGAIFMCDLISQKYNNAIATADSVSMFNGLQTYVANVLPEYSTKADYQDVGTSTGVSSYAYTSQRLYIPFGWYGNAVPSLCSTSWMVMNAFNYNPMCYAGLASCNFIN